MRRCIELQVIVLATIAAVAANSAQARLIRIWTYDDLMAKSDLVVIATAGESRDFDGPVELSPFDGAVVPQVTEMPIHGFLKGDSDKKRIDLVHCKLDPNGGLVKNGPLLVNFQSGPRTIRIVENQGEKTDILVRESAPSYLLFLKARDDGRYEPVAGVVDSELSVRKVSSAH